MDLLDAFRTFWDQYHHELTQHERLSKPALKNFDHLRKKSDQYKKSIRIKIPDLIHLIDHIPRGNLGKLRLKDPIINIPWGLEFLYLSHTAFGQFKDSVDRKITYGHPQLRSASETLHKLDSAWFLAHPKHLQQALLSFFEELSRESHIIQSDAPVSCSITLFLHHEAVPHFPSSAGPFLVLECFTPSETKEGAHHRVVSSAGGGYQSIFKEEFLEFCAVAHRNVIKKGDQFLMECFFRSTDDASSLRYVEPHMLKHRFYNRTGLSTLFFFPIRSQNLGRQNHHGF
jgi:hypothetical protein